MDSKTDPDRASIETDESQLPRFCRERPMAAIFLVSVLGLFLELLLIRWIGTEIRVFAYLQNTILVVCFLGLGLGCFTCRRTVRMRELLLPLTVLLALMAVPFSRATLGSISQLLSVMGDFVIWKRTVSESPLFTVGCVVTGLAITFFLMVFVAEMFIPIGRILGRLLDERPNTIKAYSVNIAGSLIGIWGFVALSVLYQPPFTWFLVMALLIVPFIWRARDARMNWALLAACVALALVGDHNSDARSIRWSPYQKLALYDLSPTDKTVGEYLIEVNNTGYQAIIDLSDETVAADPKRFPPAMQGYSQYDIPTRLHPDPQSVLVVGAGSGNDAAGALRQGAGHVVAVEIDPAIVAFGEAYHPERPYQSSQVTVVTDDARSYFATCDRTFDVISFGLLDSHTTTAMTNARLDHYVYTMESIGHAKTLLNEGGVMVLSFEAQKPFIADRMAGVLKSVFGIEPLVFRIPTTNYGWGGVMFVTGDLGVANARINADEKLATLIAGWQERYPIVPTYTTKITTDDWPYVYLEAPGIPLLFYLLAAMMVLLYMRFRWRLDMPKLAARWSRTHWHFFFLGGAFLLLQVQNISKASVVLGNTWLVNAVIITGVLVMILLANAIAARFPKLPLAPVYFALCGSCLALYFVDLSRYAFLPFATKAFIVGGLTTLPMLFSGIVFIRSFAAVKAKHEALGANLIGSLFGALLQSITFLIGIKALLLIVAGLYLMSMLTQPRQGRAAQPMGHPQPA